MRITTLAGLTIVGACDWRGPGIANEGGANVINAGHANHDTDGANMVLPAEEIEALKRQALAGDDEAANSLGNHYFQVGRIEDEIRWRTLAANRGHCLSMDLLMARATRVGDRQGARHWNDMLRRHVCTWGKAYRGGLSPGGDGRPLWNDA